MVSKKDIWFFALTGAILSLNGIFSPFIAVISPIGDHIEWLWGLQKAPSIFFSVVPFLLIMAVLLIVFTFVTLIFSFIARKRERLKVMGIIWLICGIGTLVTIFSPIGYYIRYYHVSFADILRGLFFGFYFPLISGILEINAGIFGIIFE